MAELVHVDDASTSETSPPQVVRIDRHTGGEPVDGVSPVRGRDAIRSMLERQPLTPGDLSLPVLVTDSVDHLDGTPPTISLRGLPRLVRQVRDAGLRSIKVFAGGDVRDDRASDAASSSSLMMRAIAAAKDAASDLAVMTENCLCSYTADGNCFLTTTDDQLDYSSTLELLAAQAVAQADAGANVLGPAAMLEGQTSVVRAALDDTGHRAVALMPHVIFASRLYGGYRRAMQAAPRTGNRAACQIHPSRPEQALDYSLRCLHEKADMLLVEPALFTVDVLMRLRATTNAPLFPFSVSGEYALFARTDSLGRDRDAVLIEYLTMLKRAGAEGIITYAALHVAQLLDRIGGGES
jgi:porphobilinogen synthase